MHTTTITQPRSFGTNTAENAHYETLRQLYSLDSALSAPASKPASHHVRYNVARCLDEILPKEPRLAIEWADLRDAVAGSLNKSVKLDRLQVSTLGSMARQHRAWSLLGQLPENVGAHALELIGAELLLAIRLERVARETPIQLAWDICMRTLDEEAYAALESKVKKYAKRLKDELLSYCTPENRGASSQDLLFDAQVVACLVSRSRNDDQKALSGTSLSRQTPIELKATLAHLVAGCRRGDVTCAIQLAAFRSGLPWPLFIKIPFLGVTKSDALLQYDVQTGEIIVDLARVFSDLAQLQGPAYTPTSSVVRLRLPVIASEAINSAYCSNPTAVRMGELADDLRKMETFGFTLNSGSITATLPRLISSAGQSAIRAGIDRGIAAYLTLRFDLIGHSANAYFNASDREVRQAEDTWFDALGVGPAASGDKGARVAIGAPSVPTEAAIACLYTALLERLHAVNPGRRCGTAKLFLFHDAFARLVAFFVALCFGSRDESPMTIHAASLTPNLSHAVYEHKKVGPNRGLSVLPVPEALTAQLHSWFRHLERLASRLATLDPESAQIQHIQDVLAGNDVPLLFLMSGGYRPMASANIFTDVPARLHLKHDFARKFFMNVPRKYGVSHEVVEAWMRHHHRRSSTYSTTCMATETDWMSQMASVLDQELGNLKIRPVVGLGK